MQGWGLRGTPGGSRPQMWVRRSRSIPRETFRLERCFTPVFGTSGREGGKEGGREGGMEGFILIATCFSQKQLSDLSVNAQGTE